MAEVTQYDLSRNFWNYVYDNPEKIKPAHIAIYFFAIEHYNRMGWKDKFGLPTSMAIEAIGIKSYNTYKTHFDDLVDWGFIDVIEYSKNQYSSVIIALSKKAKAHSKALDKALAKHGRKQSESTSESTRSIDKQETINHKPETINKRDTATKILFRDSIFFDVEKFKAEFSETKYNIYNLEFYYEKVLNWSNSNSSKKIDWIATARNFMLGDAEKGKAVLQNQKIEQNVTRNANNWKQPTGGNVDVQSAFGKIDLLPD